MVRNSRHKGSGSLAIEIMCLNFLPGNVTIINTGYYSDRLNLFVNNEKKKIKSLEYIHWKNIKNIKKNELDFFLPNRNQQSFNIPIREVWEISKKIKSRLMLDATASIGLGSQFS